MKNTIINKKTLAPSIKLLEVENKLIAKKAMPGQFIMLRVHEQGERIPLTISDFNREKGTITIIVQGVGKTTKILGAMNVGEEITDLVGPLGNPTHINHLKRVAVIGGGLGTALVFSQVKELKKNGAYVDVIIGARNAELVILEEELKEISDNVYVVTDDGSKGKKGLVTNMLEELIQSGNNYDAAIAVGPLIMMKFVCLLTKKYNLYTIVSMNPLMIDGTGMCGGCRLTVDGKTKFACVDGPEFDGHLVDFDEVMKRTAVYKKEEKDSHDRHVCNLEGIKNA